ncbi:MAG: hypothetical protein HFG62_08355 [Lachnospiraceae bacterium]|nr:hypothetical protein [Lachnospiraceae bacterium]
MEVNAGLDVPFIKNILMEGQETVIKNLEQYLEQYDVLFLFNDTRSEMKELSGTFLKSQALKNTEKNVLVLTVEENIQPPPEQQHCRTLRITKEDHEVLYRLYRMYEFSDRLRVMETEGQYGGLENYVRLGILTREEMFEALLH